MEKAKEKDISLKSTKNELFDAYNELLTKVQEEKIEDRKVVKLKSENEKLVKSVSQYSEDKIVKEIGNLKLEISKSLDELGEKQISEFKKFTEMQNAIDVEKNYLEEIYQIKINSDSLAALLRAQKDKKADFEAEMEKKKNDFEEETDQKRQQWKSEQEYFEASKKDREVQLKKERQREEEEYQYNLQLSRKKEKDEYEANKALIEKNLIEREASIAEKEKEYAELKTKVESFPVEIEKAIAEAKKSTALEIETKYKYQTELFNKEIDGERKLNKQLVTSLETKIKEQEAQIRKLTDRVDESIEQVHNIAVKAVEGPQKNASGGSSEKNID